MVRIRIGRRSFSIREFYSRFIKAIAAAFIIETRLRLFSRKSEDAIVFFGHNLDGNLNAFAHYLHKEHPGIKQYLMVDDIENRKRLVAEGTLPPFITAALASQHVVDLVKAARAKVIMTSHGPISLIRWQSISPKKRPLLIDVWHGVGYKGHVMNSVKKMPRYDAHFIPSRTVKKFYNEAGIKDENIKITGFARTDALTRSQSDTTKPAALLSQYDISSNEKRKIVVYAPTWDEGEGNDIYPFNLDGEAFFRAMDSFATKNNLLIIFRPHINTSWKIDKNYSNNLKLLSARDYPVAENLLNICDVLITDWSSIFAEYLALKRPVIFIDKKPSFGDHIGPLTLADRPGAIARSMDEFLETLSLAVNNPEDYQAQHSDVIDATAERAWGDTLDGKSCERYFDAIQELLGDNRFR